MKALIDLTVVHSHMYEHVQHEAVLEEGESGRIQYVGKKFILEGCACFKMFPKETLVY